MTIPVAIVGAGQAGLSLSWLLRREGVEHVLLEASTVAHEWTDRRWDNFTLVTPNWHCRLPGYAYDGDDPDGFMTREQVADWLAGYVASFDPPVREHTAVRLLTEREGGGFVLEMSGPDGAETVHPARASSRPAAAVSAMTLRTGPLSVVLWSTGSLYRSWGYDSSAAALAASAALTASRAVLRRRLSLA